MRTKQALFNVTMKIPRFQGNGIHRPFRGNPLLRCINRMNDRIPEARYGGLIRIDGVDVTSPSLDAIRLRREVWFSRGPTLSPMSI